MAMLTREKVIETISKFPETFSIDELLERLILMEKIEKGLKDSENNNILSEEEVEKKIREWLK